MTTSTDELRPTVPSSLVDLRGVSLAEMSALSAGIINEAVVRVRPETPTAPVEVAAFNSAI